MNDNEPQAQARGRLVPLIGEINVDTGVFTPYEVVELLRVPAVLEQLADECHAPA